MASSSGFYYRLSDTDMHTLSSKDDKQTLIRHPGVDAMQQANTGGENRGTVQISYPCDVGSQK
jgi:hypothetical protein